MKIEYGKGCYVACCECRNEDFEVDKKDEYICKVCGEISGKLKVIK